MLFRSQRSKKTDGASMSNARWVVLGKTAAVLVAAGVTASACSGAEEATAQPTTGAENESIAADPSGAGFVQPPVEMVLVNLEHLPENGPPSGVLARRDSVLFIDARNFDQNTLATVPSLQPGQDPSESPTILGHTQTFDGSTYYGLRSATGVERVMRVLPGEQPTEVTSGAWPAVSEDGTTLVVLDGSAITIMSRADDNEIGSIAVPAGSSRLALSPNAERAVLTTDEGSEVVVVNLVTGEVAALVERPTRGMYSAPRWRSDTTLSVLQIVDETLATAVVLDADSGRVLSQLPLPEFATDADFDSSGAWVTFVTADGNVKWVGDGTTGTIAEGGYLTADW
ncbi:MAG: hypothetical protein ACI8Y4_004987 [Candidatus Poriferisodalaceae bacterium]|jgi:hypothetical protein